MDTQQIQQQMRFRRASIDVTLDQLALATSAAGRRTVPALIAIASVVAAAMLWTRRRRRRRRQLDAYAGPPLLKVG